MKFLSLIVLVTLAAANVNASLLEDYANDGKIIYFFVFLLVSLFTFFSLFSLLFKLEPDNYPSKEKGVEHQK